MKPSYALNLSAKVLLSLSLVLACPLLLPAQSKDKKSNPPPPPPQQQQQPQQQQPQRQQPPPQQQQPQQQQQQPRQQQQQQPQQQRQQQPQQQTNRQQPNQQHTNQQQQQQTNRQQPNQQHTNQQQQQQTNRQQPNQQHTNQLQHESKVTKMPDGRTVERKIDGSSVERDKNNRVTGITNPVGHKLEFNPTSGQLSKVVTNKGTEATFNSQGRISIIKTPTGTVINHQPNGVRQIVTEHRDANNRVESKVVTAGPNRGFVEHRFERNGHEYVRRTYVYEGRTSVTVYRTYIYGGAPYYYYVPAYYYAPVYYGWAYNPWPAPVYYTWGWYGDPWYRPYGYYFAPYAVYPSADFWLTDYLIAENLRAAYAAQADANANAAAANADEAAANANAAAANADAAAAQRGSQVGAVTLTPEVKDMIAEEVKAQLAAEQAAAAQNPTASGTPTSAPAQPAGNTEQVPPALDPNLRVFIVTATLDVTANGQPCFLSAGDVLRRMDNAPDSDNTVGVIVLSSKKSDCGMDSSPRVQVAALQEMHNRFREQLDNGLRTLADNQGKKGIPSGPAAGGRKNPNGTAAPDLTATTDLQKQKQDADQTEKEVQQAASSTGSAGGNN